MKIRLGTDKKNMLTGKIHDNRVLSFWNGRKIQAEDIIFSYVLIHGMRKCHVLSLIVVKWHFCWRPWSLWPDGSKESRPALKSWQVIRGKWFAVVDLAEPEGAADITFDVKEVSTVEAWLTAEYSVALDVKTGYRTETLQESRLNG